MKHSSKINYKISQKSLKFSQDRDFDIKIKNNKSDELIFNIGNYNANYLFSSYKNSNFETKFNIRKNLKDSFRNINIQNDMENMEIKGGNFFFNNKKKSK